MVSENLIESNLIESRLGEHLKEHKTHPSTRRMRAMNIDVQIRDDISIIRPQSDIDSFNVSFLKKKLRDQVDTGYFNIIMDLEKVRFMDSAALGILVSGLKTCMQNAGSLGIINPSNNVSNLFKITHLDSVFRIFQDEEDAIKNLQKNISNN